MRNNIEVLSNGRKLGYADLGTPDGFPVLLFHGTPSSRINTVSETLHTAILENKIPLRIIAIDRPGYGLSDPSPNRTLHDWIKDVEELADSLNINQFSILATSGGSPYALACGYGLQDRVMKIALLSGIGPFTEPELKQYVSVEEQNALNAALYAPEQLKNMMERIHQDPAAFVNRMLANFSEEEKKRIPAELIKIYIQSLDEACKSYEGMLSDYLIFSKPWDIPFEKIIVPVHLWHSEDDTNVPIENGKYLAERLPNSELHRLSGLNHYVAVVAPLAEVVRYLTHN